MAPLYRGGSYSSEGKVQGYTAGSGGAGFEFGSDFRTKPSYPIESLGSSVGRWSSLVFSQVSRESLKASRFSQFSHLVTSDSLRPHGLQHARPYVSNPQVGGEVENHSGLQGMDGAAVEIWLGNGGQTSMKPSRGQEPLGSGDPRCEDV